MDIENAPHESNAKLSTISSSITLALSVATPCHSSYHHSPPHRHQPYPILPIGSAQCACGSSVVVSSRGKQNSVWIRWRQRRSRGAGCYLETSCVALAKHVRRRRRDRYLIAAGLARRSLSDWAGGSGRMCRVLACRQQSVQDSARCS